MTAADLILGFALGIAAATAAALAIIALPVVRDVRSSLRRRRI